MSLLARDEAPVFEPIVAPEFNPDPCPRRWQPQQRRFLRGPPSEAAPLGHPIDQRIDSSCPTPGSPAPCSCSSRPWPSSHRPGICCRRSAPSPSPSDPRFRRCGRGRARVPLRRTASPSRRLRSRTRAGSPSLDRRRKTRTRASSSREGVSFPIESQQKQNPERHEGVPGRPWEGEFGYMYLEGGLHRGSGGEVFLQPARFFSGGTDGRPAGRNRRPCP
jgi:hypothetical protein